MDNNFTTSMTSLDKLTETKPEKVTSILIRAPIMLVLALAGAWSFSFLFGNWNAGILLLAFLLVHEFGHAISMRLFHVGCSGIYVIPFLGAVTIPHQRMSRVGDAWTSLAGSIPAIAFCFIALAFGKPIIAGWMAAFTIFNLLPIGALDGGRVLRAILAPPTNVTSDYGWKTMVKVGFASGIGVALGFDIGWSLVLLIFLLPGLVAGPSKYRDDRDELTDTQKRRLFYAWGSLMVVSIAIFVVVHVLNSGVNPTRIVIG